MTNPDKELILDPTELPITRTLSDSSIIPTEPTVRQLPKHLIDFKEYVDSKFWYNSAPLEQAELISVEEKFAFQFDMKILMEARFVDWTKEPCWWENSTILFSTTIGRYFDETTRGGQPIGDVWNDYLFNLPSSDDRTKEKLALPHCTFQSRCDKCDGKRKQRCSGGGCNSGRTGDSVCSECGGSGKVACSSCEGQGGFHHFATLTVKWHTRTTTWTLQNSFLPDKNIAKAKRIPFWTNGCEPWSKESPISMFVQALYTNEQLQASIIREYQEKHLEPTLNIDNKMRRLVCIIERLDFEEISYTLNEKYVNKQDSTRGNTFRFCQYPVEGKGQLIYENDYPLNACGCFGEKCACNCRCCCRCSIL